MAARCQTGSGASLSPLMAPRAPGTSLTYGPKAPWAGTVSHDPLLYDKSTLGCGLVPSRWTAAQQHKSLTTHWSRQGKPETLGVGAIP